jgi:formylmethanofuran dehydrogenase subunit C
MNGAHLTITETAQAETITVNGSHIDIGNEVHSAAPWIDMPDFSDTIQAEAESAGQAYSGNKSYNGSYITVDDPIYVDGNLSVNGSHFTGTGVILVSGNITFNGSNLKSSGSSICFYSENGDITVNGANIDLEGVVYAPNGTIIMNGANQTVHGRLIANRVTLNGAGYEVTSGSDDLNFLPASGVMLVE